MAENKELKPKSFRIDEETAEKFKGIANQIGGNQQETLAKLIEAYEMQAGKEALADRKADIELFEGHITAITRKFMDVLADYQNLKETVRAEFEAQLVSKDSVIQDLQQRLEKTKQEKATYEHDTASYKAENISLNEKLSALEKQAEKTESVLSDKADIITSLKAELEKSKGALEESGKLKKELEELEELKEQCNALEQEKASAELRHKQEILELRQRQQEEIEKLKQEQQAQIDSYQSKYLELLDRMEQGQGVAKKTKTVQKRATKKTE